MAADVIIKDNSAEYLKKLDDAMDVLFESIGNHLEGEAKKELEVAPRRIDTGLLRNSITHAIGGKPTAISGYSGDNPSKYGNSSNIPSGSYSGVAPNDPQGEKSVYIGTNVKYAVYVHEGTSKMPPNRFLKNAAQRNEGQIKDKIKETIENIK